MMRKILVWIVCLLGLATAGWADNISVSPTRLMVPAGSLQTVMTVKAKGSGQSVVQLRAFRWNPRRPANEISAQQEVQISPPITRLQGGQELTVRIVRTGASRLNGQECYRVLVDRLPDQPGIRREVALRIRHSIPLCFGS